ncbi:MAG: tetratricopeptide repeat protein [Mariniblastus sp.]|nr:tetratricopeptide repeat protein [Mariniblastus sp.]
MSPFHRSARFILIIATCILINSRSSLGQALNPINSEPTESIKDQISNVYSLTKSADNAAQYSEIDSRCRTLLKLDLSDQDRKYVNSLDSWALCRRGLSRLDLADSFLAAGNHEQSEFIVAEAKTDFDQAIARDNQRWRGYLGRGMVLTRRNQFEAALADFQEVTRKQPDYVAGWFNQAELQYELTHYSQAIESYAKVIQADPADAQAYTGRGHCQFARGEYEAALSDYEMARQLVPLNHMAKCNCGEAERMLGHWQAAYECYMQATKVNPLPAAYRKAAWMLATCPDKKYSRPQEALELVDKAIGMQGETLENLKTLAAAQSANGELVLATATRKRIAQMESEKQTESSRIAEVDGTNSKR